MAPPLSIGTSRAYLESTVKALERLGIRDRGMERLVRAVLLADQAAGTP